MTDAEIPLPAADGASSPAEASTRAQLANQARALSEQSDRYAVALESLLSVLRSSRLDDRSARETTTNIAATALVQLRTSTDERHLDLLEPVVGAFSRLKEDVQPLVRFGKLDVEFVEPPANGRALPGEVAHAARAIVRNVLLMLVNAAKARRARIQWDCDGLNLLISIRDDGRGETRAHDDALRPVSEHVTALDGQMDLTSTPGWGTEMSITIPLDPVTAPPPLESLTALSGREKEVLNQLATGARNSEIAQTLGITEHTVKFHISKLLRKAGARNRAELISLMR